MSTSERERCAQAAMLVAEEYSAKRDDALRQSLDLLGSKRGRELARAALIFERQAQAAEEVAAAIDRIEP